MAQQTINIGTVANDGTGDPLRDAFDKSNDNFTELYSSVATIIAGLDEGSRDAIAAALVAGAGVTITVDDALNTITVVIDATVVNEFARDALGSALVAGNDIGITVDDALDTITIRNTRPYTVSILITDPQSTSIPTVADGLFYYPIPAMLNGKNLTGVKLYCATASAVGLPTMQLARIRAGAAVDMLSTKVSIDATETTSATAATPAVIDGANDDVATGDFIRGDLDVAGSTTKGLIIEMTFA